MLIAETNFRCDKNLTKALHRSLSSGSSKCGCIACRNFAVNKPIIFAKPKLKKLLADLELEDPFDFNTSFVAPSENEALYTTEILIVGNSDIFPPNPPEVFTTSTGHKFAISDGSELHPLDDGTNYSFGRLGQHLDTEIPRQKIHQIRLHIFVPWSVPEEMPSINPHLL